MTEIEDGGGLDLKSEAWSIVFFSPWRGDLILFLMNLFYVKWYQVRFVEHASNTENSHLATHENWAIDPIFSGSAAPVPVPSVDLHKARMYNESTNALARSPVRSPGRS